MRPRAPLPVLLPLGAVLCWSCWHWSCRWCWCCCSVCSRGRGFLVTSSPELWRLRSSASFPSQASGFVIFLTSQRIHLSCWVILVLHQDQDWLNSSWGMALFQIAPHESLPTLALSQPPELKSPSVVQLTLPK